MCFGLGLQRASHNLTRGWCVRLLPYSVKSCWLQTYCVVTTHVDLDWIMEHFLCRPVLTFNFPSTYMCPCCHLAYDVMSQDTWRNEVKLHFTSFFKWLWCHAFLDIRRGIFPLIFCFPDISTPNTFLLLFIYLFTSCKSFNWPWQGLLKRT